MKKKILTMSLVLALGSALMISCKPSGNTQVDQECTAQSGGSCGTVPSTSEANVGKQADSPASEIAASLGQDGVFLYYFHGKKRCATCMAIQDNSRQVVENLFQTEIASGDFHFLVVNLADEANQEIADKYKVTWSSLYLITRENGQEKVENLTELGFKKARKDPQGFQKDLAEAIQGALL